MQPLDRNHAEFPRQNAEPSTRGRRIRVAHVTPTYFADESVIGGGERYVSNLARALAGAVGEFDFEQTIVALGRGDRSAVEGGIRVRVLPNDNPSPDPMAAMSDRLWSELAGYDIVHVHQALTVFGAYCTVVAKSLRKAVVLTDLGGGENSLMTAGGGMELADGVVAISRYADSLSASKFSGPREVLIGPVDTELFAPSSGAEEARRSILCVGRILPHKGVDRIIAALPRGLRLRVIGRAYHAGYHRHLRRLSRGKDVELVLDADDGALLRAYRSSGLLVQASTYRDCFGGIVRKPELMGLTTLEAMACELPVLVSDAGSLPELVPDRDFGLVFRDDVQLAAQLEAFAAGGWPPPGAGARARAHVVANHSLPVVGTRLAAFYALVRQGHLRGG